MPLKDCDLDGAGQGLDLDVSVINDALWVMTLQSKGPDAELSPGESRVFVGGRLGPVNGCVVVDLDRNPATLHDDVLGEPPAVNGRRLPYIIVLDCVKAACFSPVAVRVVDLDFVALIRPAFLLVRRVELEVPEDGVLQGPDIEQVAAGAAGDEHAALQAPGVLVFACLPVLEAIGSAVEQGYPAILCGRGGASSDHLRLLL